MGTEQNADVIQIKELEWYLGVLPGGEDPREIIQDIVELHLQLFQDVTGFYVQLEYDINLLKRRSGNGQIMMLMVLWFTYIFTSHGLKHLLKLDPELLDIVY